MKFSFLLVSVMFYLISCQADSKVVSFDELPVFTPNILHEFDSLGEEIFFSHLGYTSILLGDGTIFLPDRELESIFKVSPEGGLISIIARSGRGPGEVQDVNFISRSFDGSILVYDQLNKKVLRFSASGGFLEEFLLQPWGKGALSELYELDENHFLAFFRSFEYLRNVDLEPEAYLVIFDKEAEEYVQSMTISDRDFARIIINDQPRGGRRVPFSAEHLRAFNYRNSGFYTFWTEGQTIAGLTASLDTANTISFQLSREELSGEEIHSIRDELETNHWRTMEPLLPEYKAIADDLIIDDHNNFWLKLNHRSEFQKWLILSESGEKRAIVQLPKDGVLTHISGQHLGFRLDDHLFALLEPVLL